MAKAKKRSLRQVVGEFESIEIDCTCFPVAIANAAVLIGRPLNADHMIRRLDEEGALKKWNQGVIDLRKADKVLRPYLEDHGVRPAFHAVMPLEELEKAVAPIDTYPQDYGISAALSYGYVRQYHNLAEDIPTAHFERVDYMGASHDVVILGRDREDFLLHDADPALQARHLESDWGAGVIRMEIERFKAFYHQGESAREATILERMRPVPARSREKLAASPARREAQLSEFEGSTGGKR